MIKYHINPETDKPGVCTADPSNPNSTGCKYETEGVKIQHYNSLQEAREAVETKYQQDTIPRSKRKPSKKIVVTEQEKKYLRDTLRS